MKDKVKAKDAGLALLLSLFMIVATPVIMIGFIGGLILDGTKAGYYLSCNFTKWLDEAIEKRGKKGENMNTKEGGE